MAMSKEIEEEIEIAKSHLMQSSLDEKCKKSLLRLLNTSTIATNGISLEEKVQKVTEAIFGMVVSQITFLDCVDKKIELANKEQCKTCKAMKVADDIEQQKNRDQIIEDWKKAHGIKDDGLNDPENARKMTIVETIKAILVKPYVWIFGSVLAFSPYGVDIVNAILNFFPK